MKVFKSFTLKIKMGNDAMQEPEDIAEALRNVIHQLEKAGTSGPVMDLNGNKVGTWEVK